jgi:ribosomal protein L7/L12
VHHPIIATFEIHFPWNKRDEIDRPARVQELVDTLCADDGALVASRVAFQAPAWQGTTAERLPGFGEADLVVGAVFEELVAGFAAVAAGAAAVGATVRVRVAEAHSDRDVDALAFLRPCVPTTSRTLVDVVLEDTGPARTGLAKHVAEIRGVGVGDAQLRIQQLPAVILEAVTPARADDAAKRLRTEHAVVTTRPSTASCK